MGGGRAEERGEKREERREENVPPHVFNSALALHANLQGRISYVKRETR